MRNPGEGSSASTTWSGIRVSAVTALLLGTSIPSMVFAQTIAEAPAASDDSTGLQDIVVTARRKEERLRDVPISVSALQGETIASRNIVQQEDLTVYVPGFRVTNGTFAPLRYIRGRSEEHTSELQSLMRISYAVFCL